MTRASSVAPARASCTLPRVQEHFADEAATAAQTDKRDVDFFRTVIAPLSLLVTTPAVVIVLWIVCTYLDGSVLRLLGRQGLATFVREFPRPSWAAAEIVLVFVSFEAA